MTPDQHPGMDELIQYCMRAPDAAADSVRLHLEKCADCRAQVELMRTDLALAAMSIPQIVPPPGAKDRLFQAAGLNLAEIEKAPADIRGAAPTKPNPLGDLNVVPIKHRDSSPAVVWGGWIAAVACLFYAVHVHDTNEIIRQQLHSATAEIVQSARSAARAEEVLEVLSSPQAQRATLVAAHAVPEPAGHAVYLAKRGALVFTASNLAPLPANKTYELWVIPANGAAPLPAGTFQPDAHGSASVLLPKLPSGIQAKAFGVTMENAGGATTPTMPILLAGG